MRKLIVAGVLLAASRVCGAATATLSWSAVTTNADGSGFSVPGSPTPAELSGYRVFYATYSLLSMTTAQAMSDANVQKTAFPAVGATLSLQEGKSYFFRLAAYDLSGNQSGFNTNGAGSDVEVATTTAAVLPKAPTALTAVEVGPTEIVVGWSPDLLGNEDGFRIEWATNPAFTGSAVIDVGAGATWYPHFIQAPGVPYYYRIRAYNARGESPNAGPATATTSGPPSSPPAAPTGIKATAVSSAAITIGWTDASNDETGFRVLCASDPSFNAAVTRTFNLGAGAVSASLPGLAPGTLYYFRVMSVNNAGPSAAVAAQFQTASSPVAGGGGPLGGLSAPAGLKEAYAYPNPAVGTDPVIRAMMGGVEEVEVTIYDQAGRVAHTGRTANRTTVNGEIAFEYRWSGDKASGVYYAVIHGKSGDKTVRARTSFAVVR